MLTPVLSKSHLVCELEWAQCTMC